MAHSQERGAGRVARIVREKGFGFIKESAAGGREFFFHRSAVGDQRFDTLQEGDEVEYSIAPDTGKGPRAERVTVL